jgi:hypothetical protein
MKPATAPVYRLHLVPVPPTTPDADDQRAWRRAQVERRRKWRRPKWSK